MKEKVLKKNQGIRVYLHEYISTVADIFEAPPNEISSSTEWNIAERMYPHWNLH